MKDLDKASDKDIYKMRNMINIISVGYPVKFDDMKKQINAEWDKRKITIVPLSWDLC